VNKEIRAGMAVHRPHSLGLATVELLRIRYVPRKAI
jgi:hypothetical protein